MRKHEGKDALSGILLLNSDFSLLVLITTIFHSPLTKAAKAFDTKCKKIPQWLGCSGCDSELVIKILKRHVCPGRLHSQV